MGLTVLGHIKYISKVIHISHTKCYIDILECHISLEDKEEYSNLYKY